MRGACESIHPDDRERAKRDFEALVLKGTPLDNESRFITEGGVAANFSFARRSHHQQERRSGFRSRHVAGHYRKPDG